MIEDFSHKTFDRGYKTAGGPSFDRFEVADSRLLKVGVAGLCLLGATAGLPVAGSRGMLAKYWEWCRFQDLPH